MSVLKFSIEKIVRPWVKDDEVEYHYTYEDGFNDKDGAWHHGDEEGGGFCKTIDEVLETIKEIVEESEDV